MGDWALTADESGTRAENGAANAFLPDPTCGWWGPDDWLVTDQHPRGFARLIDAMVRDSVPEGDERIKLNTHVSDGVFMASLTHVLIQFPTVWWDDSLPAWLATNTGGEASSGNFTPWHNFNHQSKIPGSQTLLSFLGDPQAAEYGELSEDELKAVLLERIRAQHPNKEIPEPSAVWLKNWVNDPLFYGAYVNYAPGVSWKETWKKPLKVNKEKIVQFAGEAACSSMDGYTHGAMYSGIGAAANYAYQIGKGPDPSTDDNLSLCDYY